MTALSNDTMSRTTADIYDIARGIYDGALDAEQVRSKVALHWLDFVGAVLATYRPSYGALAAVGRAQDSTTRAFALAARSHYLDFDDIDDRAGIHAAPILWPAILSAPDVTGAQALAAYVASVAVLGSLGDAATRGPQPGRWFFSQLFGGFGAVIARSLVDDAPASTVRNALGLAYMQASGTKAPAFCTGSNSRQIYPAFACRGGVFAYELARMGFDGPPEWLGGQTGLGDAYLGDPELADRLAAAVPTADVNRILGVACKPWPVCRATHPYLNALTGAELIAIPPPPPTVTRVSIPRRRVALLEPIDERTRPRTIADAKYSIPFTLAMALTQGIGLSDWTESALDDPDICQLASSLAAVSELIDPPEPSTLTVAGSAEPLLAKFPEAASWGREQAVAKFEDCAEHSGRRDVDVQSLIDQGLAFDQAGTVAGTAIGRLLGLEPAK